MSRIALGKSVWGVFGYRGMLHLSWAEILLALLEFPMLVLCLRP
jgi:hypothetical protein